MILYSYLNAANGHRLFGFTKIVQDPILSAIFIYKLAKITMLSITK